jgi:hypothetical protein
MLHGAVMSIGMRKSAVARNTRGFRALTGTLEGIVLRESEAVLLHEVTTDQ